MARRRRKFRPRGIPTSYKGINFRSQLEARWAIYLDSCGVQWAYEPFVLQGPEGVGWIPDFGLLGLEVPTLAECKPAIHPQQFADAQTKAEKSGWVGRVVLLGADPRVVLVGDLLGDGRQSNWLPAYITTHGVSRDAEVNPLLKCAWTEAVNKTQWRGKSPRRKA